MQQQKRNTIWWFIVSLSLLFASEWIYRNGSTELPPEKAAAKITEALPTIVSNANEKLSAFKNNFQANTTQSFRKFKNSWGEYLVYQNDSLLFWSGNQSPLLTVKQINSLASPIIQKNNGYYLISQQKKGTLLFVNLFPIASSYRFNNYYLQNSFHSTLKFDGEYDISLSNKTKMSAVTLNSKAVFYVGKSLNGRTFTIWHHILLLIHICAFFLLVVALTRLLLLRNAILHPTQVVLWAMALVSLRLFILFGDIFHLASESPWFNPEIFASGMWAPSLGDFFLNGWCVFFITTALSSQFEKTSHPALWVRKTAAWVLIPLFVFLSWYLQFSLRVLVQDSGISYSIRDISSFTSYSLLGLLSIGMLLFALYRLIHAWAKLSAESGIKRGLVWAILAWPLILLLKFPTTFFGFIEGSWAVLGCIIYILLYVRDRKFTLNWLVIILAFFSLMVTVTLHRYGLEKEKKNRQLLAERLSADEDPETEIEFFEFEKKLKLDKFLAQLTDSGSFVTNNLFYKYLDSAYFQRINNNYHVSCFLFKPDSTPVFSNLYNPGALEELTSVIRNHSQTGVGKSLRLIPEKINGILYAGLLSLQHQNGNLAGYLAIELRPKILPDKPGLQELLWHKNQRYKEVLDNYSVVQIIKGKIVLKNGNNAYSGDILKFNSGKSKFEFFDDNNASHLLLRTRPGHITIVSYPHSTWLSRATSFSYVFIIFILLFSVLLLLFRWQKWNIRHISLRGKIQLSLVLLLVVAMALLAFGTQYIVSNQYREKNLRLLSEKLESADAELQNKITIETSFDEDARNYVGYLLGKFSRIFHCDIHFYNNHGKLIASSLPELFRYGIVAERMDQQAFYKFSTSAGVDFVQNENISSLGFLSGYKRIVDNKNNTIGFINIPFFAPRASVDAEISSIVMAIVNIFVVLFVLALAASLVFTQIITAPLRKIQGSLASIQLNQVNQPITYTGKDEIADLVMEYNRKVAELELYASELARSERESAWREMARQVAHEIKNPLTPMKLNVQHMQRTLKSNDPDLEQKVIKLTKSLIEQIDILTHIADDFSNMAKMPLARMEKIEVYDLIENVIGLFSDTPNVKFILHKNYADKVIVKADRDQLVRVLNNLIKNSVQSIDDENEGLIEISLDKNNDVYQITISDNGIGIPDTLRDRIFKPNFTTKSTGTGLGLAMVKSIIEQHNGQIWFESEIQMGTKFYFTLPVLN